ncbi:hypothetical protein NC652_030718 [Populus alba x Populus x berolinensis]|nr:hypothetical protein NC652_030718 [Populus alba x Populus x berolinensis]
MKQRQMVIADDDDWSAYNQAWQQGEQVTWGVNPVIDNNAFDMGIDEAPYPTGKLEISDQRQKTEVSVFLHNDGFEGKKKKFHRPRARIVGLKPMGVMEEHNEERISIEEIVNATSSKTRHGNDENFLKSL